MAFKPNGFRRNVLHPIFIPLRDDIVYLSFTYEPQLEKTHNLGFRHKRICTVTEATLKLEILDLKRRGIVLICGFVFAFAHCWFSD